MKSLLINIDVPDIPAATKFYVEAFDLKVGRKMGDDFIELLGLPTPLYLLLKKSGTFPFSKATSARTYERHWTPIHPDFVVDDIKEAVARAQAAGAKIEAEICQAAYGKLAILSDPFGNGFCLIQFEGRGYDEILSE